jgi:hypothetical protein
METIIGLLFIILPVIFKIIEKKLNDAGTPPKTGPSVDLSDLLDEKDASVLEEPVLLEDYDDIVFAGREPDESKPTVIEIPEVPKQAPMEYAFNMRDVEGKRSINATRTPSPILQEEHNEKKKEKIDPKRLVIYSEIMKPKYQE